MKNLLMITAALLATILCLSGAASLAVEADFSDVAGVWYTEEYMMRIAEDGRFVMELNDEDWVGTLEPEWRTNEEEEDYISYCMTLDEPELSLWKDLELVPDIFHPGKAVFYGDENTIDEFYNIPVYVKDVTDEDLEYYEPYFFINDADEEEPAVTLMFTLLRPATDIAVMRMYDQAIDDNGNLGYNGDTLEWWPELDSQERIVVTHVFEGDLPDLSLHLTAEDGTPYEFAVQISGMDGELDLLPLLAGEG